MADLVIFLGAGQSCPLPTVFASDLRGTKMTDFKLSSIYFLAFNTGLPLTINQDVHAAKGPKTLYCGIGIACLWTFSAFRN